MQSDFEAQTFDLIGQIRKNHLILFAALFAFIWIVHRAVVQSITIDEANTYLRWVQPDEPAHWEPNSNNHVLNSLLIRFFVWMFGLNHFTVRIPALIGAAIYIIAQFKLSGLLGLGRFQRLMLFLCCVYNPFVMDYLTAARGYSLALAFLSVAMYQLAALLILQEESPRDILRRAAIISAAAGTAICANLTFSYASLFLLLIFGAFSAARIWKSGDLRVLMRLGSMGVLPILAILLIFAGSALTRFPKNELFWGARSLSESWRDIRSASFLELNPYLVNPLLAKILEALQGRLFQALAIFAAAYVVLLPFARRWLLKPQGKARLQFAISLIAVLTATVAACWLQHKLLKIPYPLERMTVFVVPLATITVGAAIGALPSGGSPFRALRGFGVAVLGVSAVFFVGEIRDHYFRECKEQADARAAFLFVRDLCRKSGTHEVATDPNLTSALKFYKAQFQANELELIYSETMPADKDVYIALDYRYGNVLRDQGLRTIWHGNTSDALVFIRDH